MKIKVLIILGCLTLGISNVFAQVIEFSGQTSLRSIVRQVGNHHSLYYNQQTPSEAVFIYKESHTTARYFRLPSFMVINDFEIDDTSTAWFCGSYSGIPMVGYFHVPSVFNGMGQVYYVVCTNPTMQYISFDRMDIMTFAPGRTTLTMVGTMRPSSSDPLVYPAVFSADFTSGGCRLASSHYIHRDVWFSDIVALDRMFVAVGTDASRRNCFLRTYGYAPDFMYHPHTNHFYIMENGNAGRGDVLLTGTGPSSVATIQYGADKTSLLNFNLSFDPISGAILLSNSLEIFDHYPHPVGYDTTGMIIHDIRYSHPLSAPLVLHEGYHSSMPLRPFSLESWIVPVGTAAGMAYDLLMGPECSLDIFRPRGFPITSGARHTGAPLNSYLHPNLLQGACVHPTNVMVRSLDVFQKKYETPHSNSYYPQGLVSFIPNISSISVNEICN